LARKPPQPGPFRLRGGNGGIAAILTKAAVNKVHELQHNPEMPKTAQETLPYRKICSDGVCILEDGYSKTLKFDDINYQLANDNDKDMIFGTYCMFLNSSDTAIRSQLTFVNKISSEATRIVIPKAGDTLDHLREHLEAMLDEQVDKGNNGLERSKYITFFVEAASLKEARRQLSRLEANAISSLKKMSVNAYPVSGLALLKVMHSILNPEGTPFSCPTDTIDKYALSSKDFISPKLFDFTDKRFASMTSSAGVKHSSSMRFTIDASNISDRILADFLDMEAENVVSIHIEPVDPQRAIKYVKGKISDIDKMKIDEERPEFRAPREAECA
jgi:hypothetical protein